MSESRTDLDPPHRTSEQEEGKGGRGGGRRGTAGQCVEVQTAGAQPPPPPPPCPPPPPSHQLPRLHHEHPCVTAGWVDLGADLRPIKVDVAAHGLDHTGVHVIGVDVGDEGDLTGGGG